MQLGVDRLVKENFALIKKKKVALLTHIGATDKYLEPTINHFVKSKTMDLKIIFAPEHGLYGAVQDQICIENARYNRLPIISMYRKNMKLTLGLLREIDVAVIDLVDIGTRYYTFVWTAILLIREVAKLNKRAIVLDRPNPLNGITVQGPVLETEYTSFVGLYPLPVRHGMTIGEICNFINVEYGINADIEVIKMQGWKRKYYFPECNLFWTIPSPNMPLFETALVYPGMCLLEGTNVSEGRGTTRPFEIFGAPYINEEILVRELHNRKIPGVIFRPLKFIPTFNKYQDQVCGGAQVYVVDLKKFDPVCLGLEIISVIHKLFPKEFAWRKPPYEFEKKKMPFDILIGNSWIRKAIEQGESVCPMKMRWKKDLQDFLKKREKYLLY